MQYKFSDKSNTLITRSRSPGTSKKTRPLTVLAPIEMKFATAIRLIFMIKSLVMRMKTAIIMTIIQILLIMIIEIIIIIIIIIVILIA